VSNALALGIDAGGTTTRWALARSGSIVESGETPGFSALQADTAGGRLTLLPALAALAEAVLTFGRPEAVCGGLTGLVGEHAALRDFIATPLGIAAEQVRLHSDIEVAYLDVFAPAAGYLIYAGTGSIAAMVEADGTLQRAGGRGVLLDDGGGGFWIAREALRRIWRIEDEQPGAWQKSCLAKHVFAHIGDSSWQASRQFVYTQDRGEVGKLAMAVAAAAQEGCAASVEIFELAGVELSRLGRAMLRRFGPRPVALAGRATTLHSAIAARVQAGLPDGTPFIHTQCDGHVAAAHIAARSITNT
jgi:glucosamine kinase